MIDWLIANWTKLAIPLLAFLGTYVVGLWLRGVLENAFAKWGRRWPGLSIIASMIHRSFLLWFMLLGIAIAVELSEIPLLAKIILSRLTATLFVVSLGWLALVLTDYLLRTYLPIMKANARTISLSVNITRAIIIVIAALIVLELWGAPTTPLLLVIAVAILVAALSLRNAAPNIFAGFQISSTRHIKPGDYIKMETGEAGYVADISWGNTRLNATDGSTIIIPNSRLLQSTVVNYGHPLKKASEPFHFQSRTHLTELTGITARNLNELADRIKNAPDAMVYFHTHHSLEEHQYLTPEPSNDFAVWVTDTLGDEVLGERLAAVDTFGFPNLGALRDRLAGIVQEAAATATAPREAGPGEEFHFMKAVSFILPTPYAAHDLREFVEILRKISLSSLYFHIFESRLRLGRGLNDFSIWLRDNLGETGLADEIARLDPYTYTLEGLRLTLIQLVEKRVK